MICDQCGYEHNSKSACPKCGARVVFVNSDYEKRKKEWEESQRKQNSDVLLDHVTISTKEEHDKKQNKGKVQAKKKDGSEMTGLSFDELKIFWIEIGKLLYAKIKKKVKKPRGKNNPVVRDLKFQDKPDDLDTSKLVLSHKVFKNHRKLIVIICSCLVTLVVGSVIVFSVIKSQDTSKVFYFNGNSGYYVTDMKNPIFGNEEEELVLIQEGSQGVLAVGDMEIYVYQNDQVYQISAENPNVITYSEDLSTIVYMENGITKVWNLQEVFELNIPEDSQYTSDCYISFEGNYYVLTVSESKGDYNLYTMYYGDDLGNVQVLMEDENTKEILTVNDQGDVAFLNMDTGDYGIVNDKKLMLYNQEKLLTLSETISKSEVIQGVIYSITSQGELVGFDIATGVEESGIDTNVVSFVNNEWNKEILYYETEEGYYRYDEEESVKLFQSDNTSLNIYYNMENKYGYCYDITSIYYFDETMQNQEPEFICELGAGEDVIYVENLGILVIDNNQNMHLLNSNNQVLEEEASNLQLVDNFQGFTYVKNGDRYVKKDENSIEISIGSGESAVSASQFMYSDNEFYYITSDSILRKVDSQGNNLTIMGIAISGHVEK